MPKITELTSYTPPISTDVIPIVDVTTVSTKKITIANLVSYLSSVIQTLTNKTIALGSNTVSGTTAQFNTALSDGDFATLAGSETLTNKDISAANNTYRAASTTATGAVELAITSEINTGTDSTRAMPVDQFVASNRNVRYFVLRVVDNQTSWPVDSSTTVGGDFVSPFAGTMVSIYAFSDTAGTTGTAVVDVNKNGTTIMATDKLKWDSTEKTTATYSGNAPTLSVTSLAANDIITVDVDTNHTTKSKGLTVVIGVRLT